MIKNYLVGISLISTLLSYTGLCAAEDAATPCRRSPPQKIVTIVVARPAVERNIFELTRSFLSPDGSLALQVKSRIPFEPGTVSISTLCVPPRIQRVHLTGEHATKKAVAHGTFSYTIKSDLHLEIFLCGRTEGGMPSVNCEFSARDKSYSAPKKTPLSLLRCPSMSLNFPDDELAKLTLDEHTYIANILQQYLSQNALPCTLREEPCAFDEVARETLNREHDKKTHGEVFAAKIDLELYPRHVVFSHYGQAVTDAAEAELEAAGWHDPDGKETTKKKPQRRRKL